jgi:RNA polymerase sigma factor (sigma-70 family)
MNGGQPSTAEANAFGALVGPTAPVPLADSVSTPSSGSDPAAWDWERLDARLRPCLLSVGERRFGFTREEAEDIVQDTFESVFTRRPRVSNMEGYLVGSFFNRCRDRLEQRIRQHQREGVPGPDVPGAATARQLVDGIHVRSAFRLLTPGCRRLIRAYCLFRQTLAETAAEAGCTVPAVWKRLNQCMKRMRGCLG